MLNNIIFNSWTNIVLRIIQFFLGGLLAIWLGSKSTGELGFSFFKFLFLLVFAYFYYLISDCLISYFVTLELEQNQMVQILQEKKFTKDYQEYQVEKIDNLKVYFDQQTVSLRGILFIPQQNDLRLNFKATLSLDNYRFYIASQEKIDFQIVKKKITFFWFFLHFFLLIYLFVFSFWIIDAKPKHQEIKLSGSFSSSNLDKKIVNYLYRLKNEPFPDKIKEEALREIEKFINSSPFESKETKEERIDLIMSLPWWQKFIENEDLNNVLNELNKNHFGLHKPKDQVVEYLASNQMRDKKRGQIICLVGPPGTGKTSLAASIAKALGRPFQRISLGGVNDEAKIRGHRKTYLGSMPGDVIKVMRRVGCLNPVICFDEIDKIRKSAWGDACSALLEVLDPEQNEEFVDHYLGSDLPFDLSKVMFICTANSLESIPIELRDRLQIIKLNSYTMMEKFQIAKDYLIPKILKDHKLEKSLEFTDEAIKKIIYDYTWGAGTRELERKILSIIGKFSAKLISGEMKKEKINEEKVRDYLKKPVRNYLNLNNCNQPGIVNGLSVSEQLGGDVLPIEVSYFPKEEESNSELTITGNLQETMRESAKIAFDYVKANYQKFNINYSLFKKNNFHIHAPRGGVLKDGPSAGIALTTAIISSLTGKIIPSKVAMTGEIRLIGQVSGIGALPEKCAAAHHRGVEIIFIPKENEFDLQEDVPNEIKEEIRIVLVDNYEQVWEAIKSL